MPDEVTQLSSVHSHTV